MKSTQKFINEISVSYSRKEFFSRQINTTASAYDLARKIFENNHCQIELKEYFFIILLNRANNVIGYHKLSEGGICSTVVDIRLAFATALKSLASGMILLHNHPSGNTKPSDQDLTLTKNFKETGKLMEICVLDHIIITSSGYTSFADEGLI